VPAVRGLDLDRPVGHRSGRWFVMAMGDRERPPWSLWAAIRTAAQEAFGAEMVERSIRGLSTRHRDVEPIAGVRAAVLARDVASGCVREYALQARSAGHSWDAIAEALGMEQVEGPASRSERAYLHLIEDRPLYTENPDPWAQPPPAAHWRCASCGQYVTDQGPFEASPENNEQGHAPGCVRHAAEMAAYRGSAAADSDLEQSTP
jgi:hypothetical protein